MTYKTFARVSVLFMFLLASLGAPVSVRAGGVCGGTFIVERGETLDTIAAMCGTTVAAIIAANPGISGSLAVGQVVAVPGIGYTAPTAPVPSTDTSSTSIYNTYNTYNTYNYYDSAPVISSGGYTGIYIVQYGDTFSGIASRFGVSIHNLWAANPQIWDINLLYVGQAISVPGAFMPGTLPPPKEDPVPLSYGTVPPGTPVAKIRLSNQARADVYVSLQGTTRDGFEVINEYPVSGTMSVKVPAGAYHYVAWVGGQKFTGDFGLGPGGNKSLTFFKNKVVVE